jgi:hypothetical protein
MILGILAYLGIGAVAPVALFLLSRTRQPLSSLGLGLSRWYFDIWPGPGLAMLSYLTVIAVLVPFAPFLVHNRRLVNPPVIGHVPP